MKAKELAEILLQHPDYEVECLEEYSFFRQNEPYTQYATMYEGEHIKVDDVNHVIFIGDN